MLHEGDGESVAGVSVQSADRPAAMPSWISPDITGALPPSEPAQSIAPALDRNAVVDDKLPAAIGDPALRAAAMAGNPAAAYEVAMRFAEGRGVAQNQAEEARWLQRAAKQGLAPAQFRLGGLYEKGLGVGRDLAMARDLYLAAARKGNGKAMHNLAVLYAEGVNGPPDYNKAAAWFRKAADHGIRDSQYNLGILYARGIGVERGDVESYKWFALAAKQGDRQAGRKRDEIASRLDPHSLAAVRLAVQEWKPEPQPEDAISVKTAAAWDPPAKYSRAARPKWRARAPAADR
jgi:localization factor PodJL